MALLGRALVERFLAGPLVFNEEWLRDGDLEGAPFSCSSPPGPQLAGRVAAAARATGADQLWVCRTAAEHRDDPALTVLPEAAAVHALLGRLGAQDVLVASTRMDSAVLFTTRGYGAVAGSRLFAEAVLGRSAVRARREFGEFAFATLRSAPHLMEVAVFFGCPISERPWVPIWQAWRVPGEVPDGSAVADQLTAVRRFVDGQTTAAQFDEEFLRARRREIERGERTGGPLQDALERVFWAVHEHIPQERSDARLMALVREVAHELPDWPV